MNKVILTGNLTKDPDVKIIQAGEKKVTVVNFTVAVSRRFRRKDGTEDQEVLFMPCEAWDSGAETIAKHFVKGSRILVEGSLKNESWEDKDTHDKRERVKLRVNNFEFASSKKKEDEGGSVADEAVAASVDESGSPF